MVASSVASPTPVGLHVGDAAAEQPGHLARMRRDHHRPAVAAAQHAGVAGTGVERVGVDHQRLFAALQQLAHDAGDGRSGAQTRADRDDVGVEGQDLIHGGAVAGPSAVSASAAVMNSTPCDATTG